jgi:hypothetical protein
MADPWALSEGRQLLGRLMHGEDVVVGVPDVVLTTTTFGIAALKEFPDSYFVDWHGRFYAGPNAGKSVTVTGFDALTAPGLKDAVLTISPAVTSVVVADLFEAYPDWSPSEMDDAINLAIAMIENEALVDKRDQTLVMATDLYEYPVPPGIDWIDEIYMESSTAGRYGGADLIDRKYWQILRGSPAAIWFDDGWITPTAGRRLRLLGQATPKRLTEETAKCTVGQAFIIYQAKANLHFARSQESNDDEHKLMVSAQTIADRERDRLRVAGRGLKVSS